MKRDESHLDQRGEREKAVNSFDDRIDSRMRSWVASAEFPKTPAFAAERIRSRAKQIKLSARLRVSAAGALLLLAATLAWSLWPPAVDRAGLIARADNGHVNSVDEHSADEHLAAADLIAIFSIPPSVALGFLDRQQNALLSSLEL